MTSLKQYFGFCAGFFIAAAIAASAGVSLGIDTDVRGELNVVDTRLDEDGPAHWTVEASNPGSIPISGRIRLTVNNGSNTVYQTYSAPIVLSPGERTSHELSYFAPDRDGELNATISFQYGDTVQTRSYRINSTQKDTEPLDTVRIRSKPEKISVRAIPPNEVETLHLAVRGNPTWRFEHDTEQTGTGITTLTVGASPDLTDHGPFEVIVYDTDGRYYYTETVEPAEPGRVSMMVGPLIDWAILAASSVL